MIANPVLPVIHDPKIAAEVPQSIRMHIAVEVPLEKLGDAIIQAPEGKQVVIILNRKNHRRLKKDRVPAELADAFEEFEVKTFFEALQGARIPAYIAEGPRNLEDCLEEILHFWPDAAIIRVVG